jgi:RND family efflux transporter MFP subunit
MRALAAFLLAVMAVACGGEPEVPAPAVRPVTYQHVFSTGGVRARTFSGVAKAGLDVPLSFKVGGTVSRLPVHVGDKIRSGQALAELDPLDYQLQVEEAEAALRQVQAQERNAEADFRRIRDLYENGNASRDDYDAARAAAESAQASVSSTAKRLELTQRQLSYTVLTAPQGGEIAEVNVEVNQNVRAGQQIVRLTSSASLEVEVTVPEGIIAQVRRGSQVAVTFDALPGRDFPAVITEAGVASTGAGTTFPVTVRLGRADPDLRAGMAAEVAFRFGREEEQLRFWLPPHAVLEDRDGRFVFVAEPDQAGFGTVRRRPVTVGELAADGLEIASGLEDGDRVVTAGLSLLTDGEKVKLESEN